jgi:hypothetical protein
LDAAPLKVGEYLLHPPSVHLDYQAGVDYLKYEAMAIGRDLLPVYHPHFLLTHRCEEAL